MKFGWEIIPGVNESRGDRWVLYAQEDACRRAELHIYPGMGMKTGGFLWKGKWYTPAEPAWSRFLQGMPSFGAPILFPTPNRVRDNCFTFQGNRYSMTKNGAPHALHGVAYDSQWDWMEPRAEVEFAEMRGRLEILPGTENWEAFPFRCRLEVAYQLHRDGFRFRYEVVNLGEGSMPYGVGLHTGFVAEPGEPVYLRFPAKARYETTPELLPTGNLIPDWKPNCDGPEGGTAVNSLKLDTPFLMEREDICLLYPRRNCRIRIRPTPDFTVAVLYTPSSMGHIPAAPEELFFVEPQTCCTDAINLHEAGMERTGLRILQPGQSESGSIDYLFEEAWQ